MTSILVSGLLVGALYSLLGAGLVLLYRQSHVLNFAHGAIGSLAAYLVYSQITNGVPYYIAALIAVGAGALVSVLIETVVIRRLTRTSDFGVAIATLALALMMLGIMTWVWGASPRALRGPSQSTSTVSVGDVAIGVNQLLSLAVAGVLFLALYLLIERTRFGLAMRAVSEGPLTADILGINVPLVRSVSWGLAGALAAVAALLITPEYQLSPHFLTTFMVASFTAIIIGGLESMAGVVIGGILYGVGSSLISYYVTGQLGQTVSLVVIIVVLAFFPNGLLGRRLQRVTEPHIGRVPGTSRFRTRVRRPAVRLPAQVVALRRHVSRLALIVGLVALLVIPFVFSENRIFEFTLVLAVFPAVLGQNVVGGYGGQASIGQSGFMVVGGYAAALVAVNMELPVVLTLLVSMAASAVVGVVLAAGAARLSGVYLAIVTLAFALAVPELASFPRDLTGGADGLLIDSPTIFGLDLLLPKNQYIFALAVCVVAGGLVWFAATHAPGRAWRAVRDSEAGAASIGLPVTRVKLSVVVIGAALAGLGGALTVITVGFISPESFTLWTTIYLLAAMIVGGSSSVLGSAIGAAIITLLPIYLASALPEASDIVFGAAVLLVLLFAPNGLSNLLNVSRGPAPTPPTPVQPATSPTLEPTHARI